MIGVFYLGVILPILLRCGVKCVQSQQIRERSELQEEVAKEQEKLETLVLGNIASADLVVDMRSVELGVRLGAGGSGVVHKATMSGMYVCCLMPLKFTHSLTHTHTFQARRRKKLDFEHDGRRGG